MRGSSEGSSPVQGYIVRESPIKIILADKSPLPEGEGHCSPSPPVLPSWCLQPGALRCGQQVTAASQPSLPGHHSIPKSCALLRHE